MRASLGTYVAKVSDFTSSTDEEKIPMPKGKFSSFIEFFKRFINFNNFYEYTKVTCCCCCLSPLVHPFSTALVI